MCLTDCDLVPAPVPGQATRTLQGGSGNGVDSVYWPVSFPENTYLRIEVNGVLPRKYANPIQGYPSIQGTYYPPIDANGAFIGWECAGHVFTAFRDPYGYLSPSIKACRAASNGTWDTPVSAYVDSGITKGSGYVMRWSQTQPSVPDSWRCGGQCVLILGGSQEITITPWFRELRAFANPSSGVVEGDSVLFFGDTTLVHTGVLWQWRPDRAVGDSVSPMQDSLRTVTGTCSTLKCKRPVFVSGTMYLSAVVNGVRQTASVHVNVAPLELQVSASPGSVQVTDTLVLTLTSSPSRPITNPTIVLPIATVQQRRAPTAFDPSVPSTLVRDASCAVASTVTCRAIALIGGPIEVSASVNGQMKFASTAFEVLPIEIEATMSGALPIDSSYAGSGIGQKFCPTFVRFPDTDGVVGPTIPSYAVDSTIYTFHGRRNGGPGVIEMVGPAWYRTSVEGDQNHGVRWLPHAFYKPQWANLTTENPLLGELVFVYWRAPSRGVLMGCNVEWDNQSRMIGALLPHQARGSASLWFLAMHWRVAAAFFPPDID